MTKEILYSVVFVALFTLAFCSQDVPIKGESYGFSVGDPYGTLNIQFFIDFQCPDSLASFVAWKNVRKSLSLQQNRVKLTYQFSPLPYHFYAATIHQAFFYVLKNAGATAAETFIDYVFTNQASFTEEVYINKTMTEFVTEFCANIAKAVGIDANALAKDLVFGSDSFKLLREHWRYTTVLHGVSGTPMFYANGVLVDGAEDYTYLDWINFIKQYKTVTHNLSVEEE